MQFGPSVDGSQPSPGSSLGRRPAESPAEPGNRRKASKVSRACDICKAKKIRCSGNDPCHTCTRRYLHCTWNTSHLRGKPLTPPPSAAGAPSGLHEPAAQRFARFDWTIPTDGHAHASGRSSSRATPDHDLTELNGQWYDRTSGLAFLHRAWQRLNAEHQLRSLDDSDEQVAELPVTMAGDVPLQSDGLGEPRPPHASRAELKGLLDFYFDTCSVTYRMFHRPSVEGWFSHLLETSGDGLEATRQPDSPRTAILYTIFAIAALRRHLVAEVPTSGQPLHSSSRRESSSGDRYFRIAQNIMERETGRAGLESVQARLLAMLYLLQTQRTNQAWYLFGTTAQMISALGLHRGSSKRRPLHGEPAQINHIDRECRKRTFWAAYTIDTYLCVVLGRPKHYHDDDIDQPFPESVVDEDVTASSISRQSEEDSPMDGLICHAKLAQLISATSREVYTVQRISSQKRLTAIQRLGGELQQWKASLPHHLGTIRPSSLVPTLRRQSIALKLAYSHAVMHLHRAIIIDALSTHHSSPQFAHSVRECLSGARLALETVTAMSKDGSLFYSLWWTQYVLFCALSVVAVFQTYSKRGHSISADLMSPSLVTLAAECKKYLSYSSTASQRYRVILDELTHEAQEQNNHKAAPTQHSAHVDPEPGSVEPEGISNAVSEPFEAFDGFAGLDGWDLTNWLELDSSVRINVLCGKISTDGAVQAYTTFPT